MSINDEKLLLYSMGVRNNKIDGDLNLWLTNTLMQSLPDNLTVHGNINHTNTPSLVKDNLPSTLVVKGKIIY